MFRYLSPSNGPVFDGLTDKEVVYAKDQPEYIPLRTLVSVSPDRRVISRWSPTAEQREAIAKGDDIFLILMTFGNPLQPIQLATGDGKEDIGWVNTCLLDDWTPATV